MNSPQPTTDRITLGTLRDMKARGEKIAMLTAYDYPTATLAQSAGVHSLLIGDSMGTVLLGLASTRDVPFELMLTLGEAVRRGAPRVYLVGDMPYQTVAGSVNNAVAAARRYIHEVGCDAIKFEVHTMGDALVRKLVDENIEVMVHLGLRPQGVLSPEGYRAQARDTESIAALVDQVRELVDVGAAAVLLEAVPNEASQAVIDAVDVPVIGCGAGPACDGHVLVTQDMLGLGSIRPPRFVPVNAHVGQVCAEAMAKYVRDIIEKRYPGPEHVYRMRTPTTGRPE